MLIELLAVPPRQDPVGELPEGHSFGGIVRREQPFAKHYYLLLEHARKFQFTADRIKRHDYLLMVQPVPDEERISPPGCTC